MLATTVANVQRLYFVVNLFFLIDSVKYVGNKIEIPLSMQMSFSSISKELE